MNRRTLELLGVCTAGLFLLGVLVGYLVWDGLQLGDLVNSFVATAFFMVLWVIAAARAIDR